MKIMSNVDKYFGDKAVLKGFSLELPSEGVIALMGPSGCGKTTLLRLIAGLELPDRGAVDLCVGGKLSIVFQEDRLLDTLCARDNIRAVLSPERFPVAEHCLTACGLADAQALYPAQMSGGMRRRLAVARAIAFDGDTLLLDEPFQGLDVETHRQMMNFVFAKSNITGASRPRRTLLVTHNIDEALAVAREIIVFNGPPLQIAGRFEGAVGIAKGMPDLKQNITNLLTIN